MSKSKNPSVPQSADPDFARLCSSVSRLLEQARARVQTAVNISMVYTYYEIGKRIIEEEQSGKNRAEYGKKMIQRLSAHLTDQFGKGFSADNLKLMRRFYQVYSNDAIGETVFPQFETTTYLNSDRQFYLSWSHYIKLMRIADVEERHFYEIEATRNNWSLSELSRQIDSSLYQRLALSKSRDKAKSLSKEGQTIESPRDAIKDPYVLEFLGLQERETYSEKELETRIIDHLQDFLLELGTGFAFVGRQVRFTFEEDHFWVDLVFFNRLLKCFVLFDLKIGKISHQDIGQMQMYVNYYDRKIKLPDENPTIGIILCKNKNDSVVELTLPKEANIYAAEYKLYLPNRDVLQKKLSEWD